MKTTFYTILIIIFTFPLYVSFLLIREYIDHELILIPIWLLSFLTIVQAYLLIYLGLITFKRKNAIPIFIKLVLALPTLTILYYVITDKVHPMVRKYINGNTNIISQNKNIEVFTDSNLNTSIEIFKMHENAYLLIHNDSKDFFSNFLYTNWEVLYINPEEKWVGLQNYEPHYFIKVNDKLIQSDMGSVFVPIGFEIKSGVNHKTIITHTDSSVTFNLPKEAIYNTIELRY